MIPQLYQGIYLEQSHFSCRNIALEEGMAITVEPGVYIPDFPEYQAYRGIGVRIEDDVLITGEGPVVLTVEAPKEIIDIEHVMSSN